MENNIMKHKMHLVPHGVHYYSFRSCNKQGGVLPLKFLFYCYTPYTLWNDIEFIVYMNSVTAVVIATNFVVTLK